MILALYDAIKKEGIAFFGDYAFNSWIIYCSVVYRVTKSRIIEAFFVLRDLKLSFFDYAIDIGHVRFSPVREVFSIVPSNNQDS